MKHCKWILYGALLALAILVQPVSAVTDYVFFAVNGDSTVNVAVQGDSLSFGATCDTGATIYWQLWLDADSNQTTGDPGDKVVLAFTTVDGIIDPEGGPPDISATPDGWYICPNMVLGFAPANYVFVVTDMTDATSAEKAFSITALASPSNSFSGTVMIEGVSAPDPQLANIWIAADLDAGMQMWSALTDETGQYQINMSDAATGQLFWLGAETLPGLVTPPEMSGIASGHITGADFVYAAPVDSIYGTVHDQFGNPIYPAYVWCSPQSGSGEKEYQVADGSFVIYFSAAELGPWYLGVSSDMLKPNFTVPWSYSFDNTDTHDIYHELICFSTDTVVYARITEQGGEPTHQYRVQADQPAIEQMAEGISGTGGDNVMALHVSHLGATCNVSLSTWDDDYPIPDGYIVEGGNLKTVAVGDTAEINLVSGYLIQDTIKVLAPHIDPDWSQVWVNFTKGDVHFSVNPDNNGVYTAYVDTGTYTVNVYCNRYLPVPNYRSIEVSGDTVGGMGYTLNYAHCHVTGQITGVPLPLDTSIQVWGSTGFTPEDYNAGGTVDTATGAFEFYVCDGDWQINPPAIAGAVAPSAFLQTVDEGLVSFICNFNYQMLKQISGTITVDPEDPPVVWSNVQVRLNGSGSYQATPDNAGNFTVYADTGLYMLDVYYINYLTTPGGYFNIHLLDDTAGFTFTLNERNISVDGYLQGVILPLSGGPYNVGGGTAEYPLGYHVASSQVDTLTGYYGMTICEGTWTFTAPDISGYVTPPPQIITLTDDDTDTTINFVYVSTMVEVSGAVAIDPDDTPADLTDVLVRLSGPGGLVEEYADGSGDFSLVADTGVYNLTAFLANYLTMPSAYSLHVLADTSGGLSFVLNERDIHVYGHLIDIALPLPPGTYNIACATDDYPAGYHAASEAVINATGEWHAWVCDGNWTFTPPDIPGYVAPVAGYRELTELDTVSALDFSYTPSSVDDPLTPSIPADFELAQNSPNPFNMGTRIEFALPKSAAIELAVYNILGQKVKTLAEGTYSAGAHAVLWNGMDESGMTVSTGIYFYRLNADEKVLVRKMVVLK
ncbi:MAG: T9SS type A sorting domain-containing protein [candidate division Zixibacteria bacterium]|nr:T9SS type A sorting domain-containing protein [candidate division Zixibacteria bacterium]